jgi:hypothetical protein
MPGGGCSLGERRIAAFVFLPKASHGGALSPPVGQASGGFGKHTSLASAEAFAAYLAPPWYVENLRGGRRAKIFTKADIRARSRLKSSS